MEHSVYGYHSSKHVTKPRKTNKNIKGLELEISDYDSGWLLDELIEEGVLTAPYNERSNKSSPTIAIENDGSVFKELIFKASCNRTLLKGVKILEDKLNADICNGHGTSCHIHLNNAYLREKDLRAIDITRATEFLAPILYKISGRDRSAMSEWTKSALKDYISIDNSNLYERAKYIEDVDAYNGRYYIVNPCDKTTEIRIFSNYYGFNYNYIKMYLECADFIIELAEFMKNKNYYYDYQECFEKTKEFFSKRKYKQIFDRQDLGIFFLSNKERQLRILNQELEYIKSKMDILKQRSYEYERDLAKDILRTLRGYSQRYTNPQISFRIRNINIEEIENSVINNINLRIEEVEQLEE